MADQDDVRRIARTLPEPRSIWRSMRARNWIRSR